ncbi:DUF3263 domain-containing protein [Gordonia malaquae]|uniref:DUF3263 domain-containing protein n=1 Tax=Gordonia malaquae TaxID=410332 RepID=UPI0030C7A063
MNDSQVTPPQGGENQSTGLSSADRAILDFAARRFSSPGAHAAAVRDEFGMSVTRYWQRITRLLDDEEALAYAPQTVYRLRRIAGRA